MVSKEQLPHTGWPLPRWLTILLTALPFLVAVALRLYLMPTSRAPLDSDEAIYLLIARHILRGEYAFFFYGEDYGGTIGSFLTAVFFSLFGDTVLVARLAQTLFYLVGMLFAYLLARRLMPTSYFGPLAALWLLALPPLLLTNWTHLMATYSILFGLGSVILYLGHRLLQEDADRLWVWLVFGAICGLAFWTFGLVAIYMLPVFLLFLRNFKVRRLHLYILAAVMFFIFSMAWWLQAMEGLQVLYNPENPPDLPPFWLRVFAFFTIMITGFFGIREPARAELIWPPISALVLSFYLLAILYAIPYFRRKDRHHPEIDRQGFLLLELQVVVWLIFFFATRFSMDATGRYITPLNQALVITGGLLLEGIYRWRRWLGVSVLAALLVFNLAVHLRVIQTPPGVSSQTIPNLWLGNQYDQALIDFVAEQGGRGYSHHWISYKIAYLSNEQVILVSFLPYFADRGWELKKTSYEPYAAAVAQAENPVFVIHHDPHLSFYLEQAFADHNLSYRTKDIGPYRVYYDLSENLSLRELGLDPR